MLNPATKPEVPRQLWLLYQPFYSIVPSEVTHNYDAWLVRVSSDNHLANVRTEGVKRLAISDA